MVSSPLPGRLSPLCLEDGTPSSEAEPSSPQCEALLLPGRLGTAQGENWLWRREESLSEGISSTTSGYGDSGGEGRGEAMCLDW